MFVACSLNFIMHVTKPDNKAMLLSVLSSQMRRSYHLAGMHNHKMAKYWRCAKMICSARGSEVREVKS